ncbi:P-loop containing nucleoside triphosphate hydrolase protein [Immersiella caudata]|uniref:P-loop containing nucleoside triphosphate hydrolase protein n=1 Tax=Immersiella caudata TaxID=314043 RepID=A0AA39WW90_9PEZI|nr:P-loop containing nucleoside triphosphate hydrolase protein [Immersiella caudata]
MSDWEESSKISAHTYNYLQESRRKIERCVRSLAGIAPPKEVHGGELHVDTNGMISPRCYHIPLPRNKRFVGRNSTLVTLRQTLFMQKKCQTAAVVGLGGVGKTQLALQLAYWAKEHQPKFSIFWAPALSDATFDQAYTEIAKKLPIQEVDRSKSPKESVRQYLSSEAAGPWLLVVDNADDMGLLFGSSPERRGGIIQYIPASENGLVLLTTRSREVACAFAGNDVVYLHSMDQPEAASLFETSLVEKSLLRDEAGCRALLEELTCLPLAITQAAMYLNTTQASIADYLGLLRNTEQTAIDVLSREFYDGTRYAGSRHAVATTWLVSFERIRKSDSGAAKLLAFLSCIEPKAIPQSILPPLTPEQMVHAVGTLCGYAFLTRRGNTDLFDMHSLVHTATRNWIRSENLQQATMEEAVRHIQAVFPTSDFENRELWRKYFPHVFKTLQNSGELDMEAKSYLTYSTAQCLGVDGRIKEAVKYSADAFYWAKSHLTEDQPYRLASQHALATAYQANGQVGEAITLLEQVVAIRANVLADNHPSRLASQHELARAYQANGQVGEAITLLEQVVAIRANVLADNHPDRLASQHELARAYQANGQVGEAITLLEQVVAIHANLLADNHPDRLTSQHTLATAYQANGQVGEAITLLEQVVAIQANLLADNHPSRLTSQHTLATAYQANGQVGEAITLLEQVVAIRANVLADNHPDRLASEGWLSVMTQELSLERARYE